MFGVPIPIHEHSVCFIKKGTNKAELIKQTSLIIWDEVPMQHCFVVDAVDRTCRDILDQPDHPFGGINVAGVVTSSRPFLWLKRAPQRTLWEPVSKDLSSDMMSTSCILQRT
jgi:hypothetical protein